MNISSIKISKVNNNGTSLYGIADIVLENMIAIHDIKIIKSKNAELLAMPSKKVNKNGFKDIVHPINQKARNILNELIFAAYEKAEKSEFDRMYFVLKDEYSQMDLRDLSIECYEVAESFSFETDSLLGVAV